MFSCFFLEENKLNNLLLAYYKKAYNTQKMRTNINLNIKASKIKHIYNNNRDYLYRGVEFVRNISLRNSWRCFSPTGTLLVTLFFEMIL